MNQIAVLRPFKLSVPWIALAIIRLANLQNYSLKPQLLLWLMPAARECIMVRCLTGYIIRLDNIRFYYGTSVNQSQQYINIIIKLLSQVCTKWRIAINVISCIIVVSHVGIWRNLLLVVTSYYILIQSAGLYHQEFPGYWEYWQDNAVHIPPTAKCGFNLLFTNTQINTFRH